MKKILFFLTILTFTNTIAQIPKLKQIKNLKDSKVIIGLSGYEDVDENLVRMVNKFWDLCPISEALPMEEAIGKAKDNDNLYAIYLSSYESQSFWKYGLDNIKYKSLSVQYFIGFSSGSGKAIMISGIPVFNDEFTDESIAHGVNYINQIFGMMLDNEVNAMKTLGLIKEKGTLLNDRILYMPEWMVDKKLDENEISEIYGGQFKIVSDFEWSRAILNKKEGVAYSIIIPAAVGGAYVFQHHVCDAETGQVLGIKYPKPAFSISAGIKSYNLSSANKGFIAKKNLKQYNDILKGK
ncbi:hypothetical protein [Maribacter sp. 2304DJ31-5]|uniref:hypothetical protein n=1 Tax=Maribacter sp. 2304DJ31-5 TaxID=3386273 RepID=UPI0039BCC9EB